MKKEQGSIAIIAIIVVAVVLLVGMYLYFTRPAATKSVVTTTSPNQTQEENIYRNSKYGYQVTLPPGWAAVEFPGSQTGASLYPGSSETSSSSSSVIIDLLNKPGNLVDLPFKEYVKVAAISEIQNYKSLVSVTEATTSSGLVGYTTIWKVAPLGEDGLTNSLPITYFPAPKNDTKTEIQLRLEDASQSAAYSEIVRSFQYTK